MSNIVIEKQANGLPRGPIKIIDPDTGLARHATALERARAKAWKLQEAATAQFERCEKLEAAAEAKAAKRAEWAAKEQSRPEDLRAKAMALLAQAEAAEAAAKAASVIGTDVFEDEETTDEVVQDGLNDYLELNKVRS